MAYFWSLIALLALVTSGLWTLKSDAAEEASTASATIELPAWNGSEMIVFAAVIPESTAQEIAQEIVERADQHDASVPDFEIDPEVVAKYANDDAYTYAESSAPSDEEVAPSAPEYALEDDGSLVILHEGSEIRVPGTGALDDPYVMSWDVLRDVQRTYNPRVGQRELPGWLDVIDGKRVVIEGNTLVPVVSTMTSELLVMQNPWDGCCIGVPPTPYDAVEVRLESPVAFGHSASGYGRVEGSFEVDPYEVSGWLMGLFLINDASYTSGAGVALPDL